MAWSVELDPRAAKELRKLDKQVGERILSFLKGRIATEEDPRRFGKALKGEMSGLWRYRVGSYRLICELRDEVLLVLVLRVTHRREAYR